MLAVRIQAIDGAGTFTPPDSQPCRLLPPVYASLDTSQRPAQNLGPSGSLLLSREVGSRTGAVPLRSDLSVSPRFLWECLTSRTVSPFPAPAASHPACGFPALGAPVCFISRLMGP